MKTQTPPTPSQLRAKIMRYERLKAELRVLEREIKAEGAARLRQEEGLLLSPRIERIIERYAA